VALNVDAVLFDLGGTVLEIRHDAIAAILARHGHVAAEGWRDRGERAGRRAMEETLRAGAAPDVVWRAFFEGMMTEAGAPPATAQRAFPEVRDYHRSEHLWNRVLPGMDAALEELARRGYRVAAVSNSDGRADALLRRLGLADRFEFVVDSHDVGVEKPARRIFEIACERLGLPAGRCAYVGDVMAFDVEGARGAGLVPVLFDAYGSYDAGPADGAHARGAAELLALFPGRAA
jgi:putative hydrolase of the HAD superfamily